MEPDNHGGSEGFLSECLWRDIKGFEKISYRELRCIGCGFEEDGNEIGKPNIRESSEDPMHMGISRHIFQMMDVSPNRWRSYGYLRNVMGNPCSSEPRRSWFEWG